MKQFALVLSLLLATSIGHAEETPARESAQKDSRSSSPAEQTAGAADPIRILGAGVGTAFGLGLGHPFQGRYMERGWIFTVAEVAGGALIISGGIGDCVNGPRSCGDAGRRAVGVTIFVAARVVEILDLWTHLNKEPAKTALVPVITPDEAGFALLSRF